MPVLMPTKEKGATTKAAPLIYAEPAQLVTDADLTARLRLPDTVNGAFIADVLSGFLTHERCGRHLYKSVATRTNNPILKQRYEHFGEETEHHADVLEQLITDAGGNPNYVSPMARAVEAQDSKLLESTFLATGALDIMTAEMAMLDAVFVAEAVDRANWEALEQLTQQLPDGELRNKFARAVSEVLADEEEHLTWAKETRAKLTLLQAKSSLMASVGEKAEEMMATVRSWLS